MNHDRDHDPDRAPDLGPLSDVPDLQLVAAVAEVHPEGDLDQEVLPRRGEVAQEVDLHLAHLLRGE